MIVNRRHARARVLRGAELGSPAHRAVALAALAQERGRVGASGAAAALGVSAKLFPATLVPAALAALAAGPRPRALLRYAAALGGLVLLVNLPFALAAPENWSWFFRFNAGRGAENSIRDALAIPRGPLLEALSAGPRRVRARRRGRDRGPLQRRGGDVARAARLATGLALVVWIATNKIWCPVHCTTPGGARSPPGQALFGALTAVSIWDFHVAFEVRAALGTVIPRSPVPPDGDRPDAPLALAAVIARGAVAARGARSGSGCPRGFLLPWTVRASGRADLVFSEAPLPVVLSSARSIRSSTFSGAMSRPSSSRHQ